MKKIYSNSLGEQVEIEKTEGGNFILYVADEVGDSAEICIPVAYAMHIAKQIIEECK